MTTQTPAIAEIEKSDSESGFSKKMLTLDPGPKEKRRIEPESTPALWICGHLW